MKKTIIIFIVASFFIGGIVSAQGMMGTWQNSGANIQLTTDTNVQAALQSIYQDQKVNTQDQISCAKVSNDQFEKLGDAYMGVNISEQQHTAMDQMMGGEGSPTLTQAHITMGRAYLGCWSNYNAAPVYMPMMQNFNGSTYAPNGYSSYGPMMSWYGTMSGYGSGSIWFNLITMILSWLFLILGIAALLRWLSKNKK